MPRRSWQGSHLPLDAPFILNRASPQANGLQVWLPDARRTTPLGKNGISSIGSSVTVVGDSMLGQAYSVDGTANGWLQVAAVSGMVGSQSPWSFAIWAYPTNLSGVSTPISVAQAAGSLLSTSINNRANNWRVEHGGGSTTYIASGVTPVANVWVRLFYTWDGTNHNFYVNGLLAATAAVARDTVPNDTFNVGRYSDVGFAGDSFIGLVLDARYYSRCVPAAVVWQDYEPSTRFDLYQPLKQTRHFQMNPYILFPDPIFVQRRL